MPERAERARPDAADAPLTTGAEASPGADDSADAEEAPGDDRDSDLDAPVPESPSGGYANWWV